MTRDDQFHDGSLDGLLIEGTSVAIFLSTEENGRFVLVAKDVMAMTANGFLAGNIIFEVAAREGTELISRDIRDVYGLHNPHNATGEEAQIKRQLQKAQENRAVALEINPSYGASCLIVAKSIELMEREEWLRTLCQKNLDS